MAVVLKGTGATFPQRRGGAPRRNRRPIPSLLLGAAFLLSATGLLRLFDPRRLLLRSASSPSPASGGGQRPAAAGTESTMRTTMALGVKRQVDEDKGGGGGVGAKDAKKAAAVAREDEDLTRIQRIYYINLPKNTRRRDHMEGLLSGQFSVPYPYKRVDAVEGDPDVHRCVRGKEHPDRCRGLAGLALSNLHIIDHLDTTGVTLVLEDDFNFRHIRFMENALRLVPPDWDVVRFQCLPLHHGYVVPATFRRVSDSVYQTAHERPNGTESAFCAGTVNMFWRGSSVQKLRALWSEEPFDDIDCRLTTDRIKSYCIDQGLEGEMHAPPDGELSDIPNSN